MKQAFSTNWNSSKRPAKQRKYVYNLPLHTQSRILSVHLSSDLRKKHNTRSTPVAKGDKVKVLRGQHKGRENKVERVDHKKTKVYIMGIETTKKDGSKSAYPIKPSNIMITELNLEDKKRLASIERKGAKTNKTESAPVTEEKRNEDHEE
ncbi:50S ribosomal protein L24 [Candidatus Woesearchaeota archaeon]|nr:50S ribosomal protein L24 [Candidatus Woesearchaeota archaeon]